MTTRKSNVKWGDAAVDLAGNEVKVGQKAPDFSALDLSGKSVSLKDTSGVRIFSSVPSLDTKVCDVETRRFNVEAGKLPGVTIYTVSVDLPAGMKRWCGAAGVSAVQMLSDHRSVSFGEHWGVLEPSRRMLARAVFVIDKDSTVRYVEYVSSVGSEPDYDKVISATKALL